MVDYNRERDREFENHQGNRNKNYRTRRVNNVRVLEFDDIEMKCVESGERVRKQNFFKGKLGDKDIKMLIDTG